MLETNVPTLPEYCAFTQQGSHLEKVFGELRIPIGIAIPENGEPEILFEETQKAGEAIAASCEPCSGFIICNPRPGYVFYQNPDHTPPANRFVRPAVVVFNPVIEGTEVNHFHNQALDESLAIDHRFDHAPVNASADV